MSYVNRRIERQSYPAIRADSLFNPVPVIITPGSRATQLIGLDASHYLGDGAELYGRFDYDMNLERTVVDVPLHAGVPGAAAGLQRRQGRNPASLAAAALGKKRTFSLRGAFAGQIGRQ